MIDPVLDQSEAVALLASWPRLKMCLRQKHRKKEKKKCSFYHHCGKEGRPALFAHMFVQHHGNFV